MTQHTPGRWYTRPRLDKRGNLYSTVHSEGFKRGVTQALTVAVVRQITGTDRGYDTVAEVEANSALIVQAPAMLEALTDLMPLLDAVEASLGDDSDEDHLRIEQARAALAAAEGRDA